MENGTKDLKVVDGIAYMPAIKKYLYTYTFFSNASIVLTDRSKILYENVEYIFAKRPSCYNGIFIINKSNVYTNIEEAVDRIYNIATTESFRDIYGVIVYTTVNLSSNDIYDDICIKDLFYNVRNKELSNIVNDKIATINNMIANAKEILADIDKEKQSLLEAKEAESHDIFEGIDNDTKNTIDYLNNMISRLETEKWRY